MDVNTIISRIQNPALVETDEPIFWNEVTERYPYFSIGRILEYMNEKRRGKEAPLEFVSMYKQNPLLFAQCLLEKKEHVADPIQEKEAAMAFVEEKVMSEFHEDVPIERMDDMKPFEVIQEEKQPEPSYWAPPEPVHPPEVVQEIIELPKTEIPVWNEPPVMEVRDPNDWMEEIPKSPVVEDYITSQAEGIANEHEAPLSGEFSAGEPDDRSLMVMMDFMDWLQHFQKRNKEEQEEEKEKKALKAAWQKEKLNAIIDEEGDEIPEGIFKQAMESVSSESGIVSESLAQLLAQQGKTEKAIEMYRKLSLRNPEKNAYFADLIRKIQLNTF